jgi:hypothetical protein
MISPLQVERFFGVPEYLIFPTMISSPVFTDKVLQDGAYEYPSFKRTYIQLRDLLIFLAATLGLVAGAQLSAILTATEDLGELLGRQLRRAWPRDRRAPIQIRDALLALINHLAGWQLGAALDRRLAQSNGHSSDHSCDPLRARASDASYKAARKTLVLMQRLLHTVGNILQVEPSRLSEHLEMQSRAELWAKAKAHQVVAAAAAAGAAAPTPQPSPQPSPPGPASPGGAAYVTLSQRAQAQARPQRLSGQQRAESAESIGGLSSRSCSSGVDGAGAPPPPLAPRTPPTARPSGAVEYPYVPVAVESLASGLTNVLGFGHHEATLSPSMHAGLAEEHMGLAPHLPPLRPEERHPLLTLCRLLKLEALETARAVDESASRLASSGVKLVLRSLLRASQTLNPSGEPLNEQARRQLVFFCNSLHHRRLSRAVSVCDMPSLTSFTPHYSEDVTYSMDALQVADDDNASLLTIIKSLYPDEWANLCERIESVERTRERKKMVQTKREWEAQRAGALGQAVTSNPNPNPRTGGHGQAALPAPSTTQAPTPAGGVAAGVEGMIVQDWCSDRSQLLSRTVRGVMRHAHALRLLAMLEGVPRGHVEDLVASKFQYLVTCQIYDKLQNSSSRADQWKAEAIDLLRMRFPRHLRIAYVEYDEARGVHSSVLLGPEPTAAALDGASPAAGAGRVLYKVKLPGDPIIGEGKPENQNHAVIFAHGEYLQTLDMNQDNYLGESLKMRNLLELFTGDVRLIGFREHIISDGNGLVAGFAADSEFVFGTMIQRFMAWPLEVRLHYGHPDVWDAVWCLTSGGISKASKTIHVSEDVFGGANIWLRGGSVDYTEFIHVGKARDITFTGINGFEQKISGGNALQCMSRDYARMSANFDLFRLLSLYMTSVGFFLTSAMMHVAIVTMLLSLISLALCRAETYFDAGEVPFEALLDL